MSFPAPDKLAQNAGNPVPNMKLDGMVMEPKFDGFRLLVNVSEKGVDSFTRTGKSQKGKLPHIEAAFAGLPAGTWLDGELVAFSDDGVTEWGSVQSVMGSNVPEAARKSHVLTYLVFDVLAFDGLDLRPLPLSERRAALKTIIGMVNHQAVRVTPQFPASSQAHDELVAQGWEGTIVKDPTKPYASGKRGHGWTKLKASDELDVVIMGFKPGENSFSGMIGAIEFGQYKNGVLTYRGRCSGMDMKTRKDMTASQSALVGCVISIAHMGIMPSGSPRHPQYKRFRIDKPASDCVWT